MSNISELFTRPVEEAEIEKEEGDVEVVYSQIMQYENEPLAEDKSRQQQN